MHTRICTTTITALCTLLAASACGRGEQARAGEARPAAEAASPAATPAQTSSTQEVGLEAARRMPQTLHDSVRASFGRDTAAAASALRSASAFARQQAQRANETARTALNRSAEEMDSLAASIAAGARHTEARVDSAFARLEQAEGLRHLANAMDAWAAQQRARAGEELDAAADNFERAAHDAQVRLDAGAEKAAADARAVARRARQNAEVSADEFRRVTAELEAQLQALGERISRRA